MRLIYSWVLLGKSTVPFSCRFDGVLLTIVVIQLKMEEKKILKETSDLNPSIMFTVKSECIAASRNIWDQDFFLLLRAEGEMGLARLFS